MSHQRCADFFADLETRDIGKISKWFADDSQLWIPPSQPVNGIKRICTLFRLIFRRYSELHWQLTEAHEFAPNRAICFSTSWGTLADSKPYKNQIATLFEFNDAGKITLLSDYFKDTAIFTPAVPA